MRAIEDLARGWRSWRRSDESEGPAWGQWGLPVVGAITVPLGVGTQTSNLRTLLRHSCPEAHCPTVQVHELCRCPRLQRQLYKPADGFEAFE